MQQYIEELLSCTRESILKESLMDYIIRQWEYEAITGRDRGKGNTLYILIRASSLTKGWNSMAVGKLSSEIFAWLLPLIELLCARSSDSAFSYNFL